MVLATSIKSVSPSHHPMLVDMFRNEARNSKFGGNKHPRTRF